MQTYVADKMAALGDTVENFFADCDSDDEDIEVEDYFEEFFFAEGQGCDTQEEVLCAVINRFYDIEFDLLFMSVYIGLHAVSIPCCTIFIVLYLIVFRKQPRTMSRTTQKLTTAWKMV